MAKYYSQLGPSWSGVQVGTICMMPKDENGAYYAPDGWQECNGRSLNPNEFLALYQIIGNTYGGNASAENNYPSITGTFKVPDLRDRRPIGTGRLRPDGSSPQLVDHDSGDSDTCGSKGGQNILTLADVAPRVQVQEGSVQIAYNTSRTATIYGSLSGGTLDVTTGALSTHTAPNQPAHSHGTFDSVSPMGGTFQADRTSPGNGDSGIKTGASARGNHNFGAASPPSGTQPHSHWMSFRSAISGTTSYHKGFGDAVGERFQNTNGSVGNGWYNDFCTESNVNMNTQGACRLGAPYDNGSAGHALIKPKYNQLSYQLSNVAVNGTAIGFELDVDLGLDNNPDIKPEFQETAYMIYMGVNSTVYAAPPPPTDTGDNTPDTPANQVVTTNSASGLASTSITLSGADLVYSFTVQVTKTGGQNVGSTPINVNGQGANSSGTATNVISGDTVNMTLEGPAEGGASAIYTVKIFYGTELKTTSTITVTYAAAPALTLSASPDAVTSGSASTITWSSPGATSITAVSIPGVTTSSTATGGSVVVNPTTATTYSMTVANTYGSTTSSVSVGILGQDPPTAFVTIFPSTITIGESAIVQYNATDATTFVSSNIPGASSAVTHSVSVTPTTSGTITYNVVVSNAYGNTTATADLVVDPLPLPTVSLSASPSSYNISDPDPATVTWSTQNGETAVFTSSPTDAGWDAQTTLNGSYSTDGITASTTYTLAVTNSTGTTTQQTTVSITQLPVVTMTLNPTTLAIGSGESNPVTSSTLTWSSTDATTVTASNFNASTVSGSTTVSPTETTTYSLTVQGPAGSTTETAVLTVNCTAGTGTTTAGYGTGVTGYLEYNDGTTTSNELYVTGFVSSWLTQTAKGSITYQQLFDQIVTSYDNILSRKPDGTAFDGWTNEFINNANLTTLTDLNTAIYNDANGLVPGASNELGQRALYNGLLGNFNECGVAIYP